MLDRKSELNEYMHNRPKFPKRAVVTAGMPYGNKELHLGHIGGVFIHADTFARFLRDRIGKENVIFLSGTDCYGSPILESYRKALQDGDFKGSINDFVEHYHHRQKETLEKYNIAINQFAASSFGTSAKVHNEVSNEFINTLYANGYLTKTTTSQFYDVDLDIFLNGRQVVGKCPIEGCSSEMAYADECSLGHQYRPVDLIDPKSTVSGKKPDMKDVTNWYFNLDQLDGLLNEWVAYLEGLPNCRRSLVNTMKEFLKPPVIYVKKEEVEKLALIKAELPNYKMEEENKKASMTLTFDNLEDRDQASSLMSKHSIRFRTGKAVVPFRLTGNIEWGVPVPTIEDIGNLTFWVWPESLWAPISFTRDYLNGLDQEEDAWKQWWCATDSRVYQFIGEDNIYFYALAEMGMFMAMQGKDPSIHPAEGQLQLPSIIANAHVLFLDKKASSSGKIKPPTAMELLEYYTAEQLRSHFLGMSLGVRSSSFQPKPLKPKASEKDSDPVLKEGNLLTNVLNRIARSCFYTAQQYYDGNIPVGSITEEILEESFKTVLEFENLMYRHEFHTIMNLMDSYIRNSNKGWVKNMKLAEQNEDVELRTQTLMDTFHELRIATVLMHSIAPEGTEMIREYLNMGEEFWDWDKIFHPIYDFMADPETHRIKFLAPKVDFFKKHEGYFSK